MDDFKILLSSNELLKGKYYSKYEIQDRLVIDVGTLKNF